PVLEARGGHTGSGNSRAAPRAVSASFKDLNTRPGGRGERSRVERAADVGRIKGKDVGEAETTGRVHTIHEVDFAGDSTVNGGADHGREHGRAGASGQRHAVPGGQTAGVVRRLGSQQRILLVIADV